MKANNFPEILKANRVIGQALVFSDAIVADASFILSLRTDEKKSLHLSQVSDDVGRQVEWLEKYSSKSDQAYFIIETKDGNKIGTVRLYDQQGESFCWGSWILSNDAPKSAAIESALMVYSYATVHLGFKAAHFDVRKANESVWRFHERFGALRVGETEQDYLYAIQLKAIEDSMLRYRKYLPSAVRAEAYERGCNAFL